MLTFTLKNVRRIAGRAVFTIGIIISLSGGTPSQPANRTLVVSDLDKDGPATAILINSTGPQCRTSLAVTVPNSGEVDLSSSVNPACWSCNDKGAGLSVHARGRAVAYLAGSTICKQAQVAVQMRKRTVLAVHIWPRSDRFRDRALDDIVNTDWMLDQNLAGVSLMPVMHDSTDRISDINCETNPPPKELTSGGAGLDIYYGGGLRNQSCEELDDKPTHVLIHDVPVLGDIAHELGHSLGLNQRDQELKYETGHTTAMPAFDCSNALWQGTEVLTDHYSMGQAFWLHLSGSSAFARRTPSRVVGCSGKADSESPCPPFSLMHPQQQTRCHPCSLTLEQARRIRSDMAAQPATGATQICSPAELLGALSARYDALVDHTKRNPGLKLASPSRADFIRNWRNLHGMILEIEAVARTPAESKERTAGIDYLNRESTDGEFKGRSYIKYAAETIKADKYRPRCETESQPQP